MAFVTDVNKETLIQVALSEFVQNSYVGANLEEIATLSECSISDIYKLFDSKLGLFNAVAEYVFDKALSGPRHYSSVANMLERVANKIKLMVLNAHPYIEFMHTYFYSLKYVTLDSQKGMRKMFESTDAYDVLKSGIEAGQIINDDPFNMLIAFIRSTLTTCKAHNAMGLDLPPNENLINIVNFWFNDKTDLDIFSHFDDIAVADEVLKKNAFGLWATEFEDGKAPRMYGDRRWLSMIGVKPGSMTPEQLFEFYNSRIPQEEADQVRQGIEKMKQGIYVEVQYSYKHPDGLIRYCRCGGLPDKDFTKGVRIQGTHQDITEIVKAQLQAKQGEVFHNITSSLSKHYEVVYHINIKTNAFKGFFVTDKHSVANIEMEGDDFFESFRKAANIYVNKNDLRQLSAFVEKSQLLESLKKGQAYSNNYRLEVNGETSRYRMNALTTEDPDYIVIGVENIDSILTQREEAENKTNAIINNVAASYDFLSYASVKNEEISASHFMYHTSKLFKDSLPNLNKEKNIFKKLHTIIEYLCSPKEQENVLKAIRNDIIIDNLYVSDAYEVTFKAIIDGEESFYKIKFTPERRNKKVIGVVIGIRSIDKDVKTREKMNFLEKEAEESNAFSKLFADAYRSAYYVNLEEDSVVVYKRNGVFVDQRYVIDNFEETFADYTEEDCFEPDRKNMLRIMTKQGIESALAGVNSYSFRYRDISLGQPLWYRCDIVRSKDKNIVAIGFVNIDDVVKKEENHQVKLEQLVSQRTKEMEELNHELSNLSEGIFQLLGDLVEGRDKESGEHVNRVKGFTYILAKKVQKLLPEYHLTNDDIDIITLASTLHDIGKISISDTILLKPGKLTKEEFEIMKTHTTEGTKFIEKLRGFWPDSYLKAALDITTYHHEKWDGSGYPCGLVGDETPISAQIVAIADCFDALTSERVYKEAYDPIEAYEMICRGECGPFSDKLINCFAQVKDEFIACRLDPLGFEKKIMKKVKKGVNKTIEMNKIPQVENKVDEDSISLSTLETILSELPGNIFFKDTKCRYLFSSNYSKQNNFIDDPDWSIRGKTDLDIGNGKHSAKKAYSEDKKILKTGRASKYVIKDEFSNPGEDTFLEVIKKPVRNDKKKIIGIVGQILDVTERMKMENTLTKLARTDELTGFANRSALEQYLAEEMENDSFPLGIIMADCDRLKYINDTFGHKYGDIYLKRMATVIAGVLPDSSKVYRTGGDEFLIVNKACDKSDLKKLEEELREQSNITVKDTKVSLSVGSALMEWPDEDFKAIADLADKAMYKEKRIKHSLQASQYGKNKLK